MTTATTTNVPRVLTPAAEYFSHDGAAFVRLTPSKSLKNAAIIYESIKNLPDKTLVRGDFDRKTRPYIFFPKRTKKKIGLGGSLDTIALKNIEAGRKEIANILSSIAIEGVRLKEPSAAVCKTALLLKRNISITEADQRDFKVGDIKESLRILANAYHLDEVRKKTSPHRLLGRGVTKIQNKRLREFVAISKEKADEIYVALRVNLKKYDLRPEMGLFAVKVMIKQFLDQNSVSSKSFASFVRQNALDPDIQFFAQHWHAISHPFPTDERIQFLTEPWAKELDRICEIVIKSNRRSTRLTKVETVDGDETPAKAVLQQSTSKLSLGVPKTVNVVYSSLKSQDTEDFTSFPSSPYQPKKSSSSSSASVVGAPLVPTRAFGQAPEPLVVPESPKLSDYFNVVSEHSERDTELSAQSTLSPANETKIVMSLGEKFRSKLSALSRSTLPSLESDKSLNQSEKTRNFNDVSEHSDRDAALSAQSTLSPANENKTVMSLGEKFKSQLSALSRSTLPSLESDTSLNQSEKTRLLNNTEESSQDQTESSPTEEKM
ncbi:hypothetical protein MCEMSE6_02100 [Oxalobacteraceae bacterium]